MKKSMILAAAAALVLCACAKVETVKITPDEAVSFGVYAGNAVTKAVSNTDFGTVTTASLQTAASNGFGVFAYYTNDATYASNTKANFMYNQKVTYSAGNWGYTPVKYWPNEHGTSAVSSGIDRLTFLAYAPWVENLAINGNTESTVKDDAGVAADEGIIAMTGNTTAEDAKLTFKVPASAENQIDLLYGTLGAKSVNVDGTEEGTIGGPIKDLTKEKTNGKVNILFKHALAKVAIDIKEVVDREDPTSTVNPASNGTKVVVKSVKLIGTNIGTQGKLNLYTGLWGDMTKGTEFNVTPLPAAIAVDAAPTAYPGIAGVDEDGLDSTIDFMLIPYYSDNDTPADDTDDVYTQITGVQIVYYVCTEDANLENSVSVVENTISKDLATALNLEKGKAFALNLLLGLTSVDLTATVSDWDDTAGSQDVDLPQNVTPAP